MRLRRRESGGVELAVADDGRGFAFDESEGGLGIAGMRERALLIGGELTIESRPGARHHRPPRLDPVDRATTSAHRPDWMRC